MPATSKNQWEYMKAVCDGRAKPPKHMTREQACEYISSQHSPEGLPEKAKDGIVVGERASDWLDGAYDASL